MDSPGDTMSDDRLLDDAALVRLTGRKQKSRQIEWLRAEGLPFRVNATGHAVVTWAAVEGRREEAEAPPVKGWTPRVIDSRAAGA
jgi:hypothetical protein